MGSGSTHYIIFHPFLYRQNISQNFFNFKKKSFTVNSDLTPTDSPISPFSPSLQPHLQCSEGTSCTSLLMHFGQPRGSKSKVELNNYHHEFKAFSHPFAWFLFAPLCSTHFTSTLLRVDCVPVFFPLYAPKYLEVRHHTLVIFLLLHTCIMYCDWLML